MIKPPTAESHAASLGLAGCANRSAALICSAMIMWTVTEVVGGLFLKGMPILQIVWLRYACHLSLMLFAFGIPHRLRFLRTGRPFLQISRSLLMLTMPLCYAVALGGAGHSDVMGVFWIAPVLVLVMAPLAGDRVPPLASITAITAWLGALVIYRPPIVGMGWAAVAAVGMATSFSGYVAMTRVLDRTASLLTNLFYSAAGVFVALSLVLPSFWSPITPRVMLGGMAVAVVGWMGLYLLDLSVRRESTACLAPFLYIQVLIEAGLRIGRGFAHQTYSEVGAALTLAALATAYLGLRRQSPEAAS